MQETRVRSLSWKGPWEKEMATHSGILFFKLINLLAVLGLCCCTGFSLLVESGGCAPAVEQERLIVAASLHGLEGMRAVVAAPGSTAQAQQLWCPVLDARWHGGSSQTRE